MFLSDLVQYVGYEIENDVIDSDSSSIKLYLRRKNDKDFCCAKCGHDLGSHRGKHRMILKEITIMGFKVFVHLFRLKGECHRCKKARSERIDFLSHETPHATKNYSLWLGKLAEITTTTQAAWLVNESKSTVWRADLERMERMLSNYHIPPVTAIAVDEVYIGKLEEVGDNRNDQFFTIITDLTTRRVLWVTESRRKAALDKFFKKIGPKRCGKIKVVATDQHDDYIKSAKEFCPQATHVLDRFHVMKNFEEAVNDTRKDLRKLFPYKNSDEIYKNTAGKYRFIFLKRASKRTPGEQRHIEKVCKENVMFMHLELIKERMISFFDAITVDEAEKIFDEVGEWIFEAGFPALKKWWKNLSKKWSLLKNYFTFRVTTAVSEGINNLIKSIKRRSFGFRTVRYFKLKILQACGYISARYMRDDGSLTFNAKKLLGCDCIEYYHEFALL